jgi:transketolase
MAENIQALRKMAQKLRKISLLSTSEAGSGHPTTCMSCADILSVLFFHEMRFDPTNPKARNADAFVLSKGHAAPILWAALHEAGALGEDPMTLRRIDSSLEGHPTPNNPWVRVATGSLGQGLSAAAGMALANKLDTIDARVFCLLGDGECSEGSVWEAAQFASLYKLDNLVAIVDVNGLGQSGPAPYGRDASVFVRRFESFGWKTVDIDGHDIDQILRALEVARKGGPTAILARTIKGKGVSFLEGIDGWHGKPVRKGVDLDKAVAELGDTNVSIRVQPRLVGRHAPAHRERPEQIAVEYSKSDRVATREAYGTALKKLGAILPEVVVLDADTKNSTFSERFKEAFPDRMFEAHIAEQNMVGVALGLGTVGKIPFASTFACFLTRAYDFIRMAAHSRPPHLILCGSHAGVSIGEDGPSQMGLEDLAMMRALIGATVLYPSDAVSAERLTEQAALNPGLFYIRTTRPRTAILYSNGEKFPIGGSKVLRSSDTDVATIVAAGITVHEALAAHEQLKVRGINVRVIDAYSVKPIDAEGLRKAAAETREIVVVEDHALEGGLGSAVLEALSGLTVVHRLGVSGYPRSARPEELMQRHGISAAAIAAKVSDLAARTHTRRAIRQGRK